MARYEIGYGGVWRERFDDGEAAIRRAEELAASGEVVEVARRFLGLHAFVTAFPESEREALKARRGYPYVGELWGFGVGGEADPHHGGAPGDHAGDSHGSSHGGGHDGGSHGGGSHGGGH
jgi:uncharacterized membrane protein YgcG